MTDTDKVDDLMKQWAPPVGGAIFFILFVSLGIWQLGRAFDKHALREAFENPGQYLEFDQLENPEPYDAVTVTGEYLAGQQVLVRNVVKNDRFGYYVLTGLRREGAADIVVVNRGWIPREAGNSSLPGVAVEAGVRTIRGRVGALPKVGIRSGPVFGDEAGWPREAAWPEAADLASAWGVEVAPVVVLLGPQDADGYLRQWQPPDTSSLTHYSYAFQWFVMALAVLALLLWRLRRRNLARRIAGG